MNLSAVVTSYFYAHDLSLKGQREYRQKLGAFTDWHKQHEYTLHKPVRLVEDLNKYHFNEFLAYLRSITNHRQAADRPIAARLCAGHQGIPQLVHQGRSHS